MPAAYRSASANGSSGNIVINRPTGVVNNDVLFAFVRPGFQGSVAAPAGWTQFRNDTLSANHAFQSYWKAANNEPASESWTNTGGSGASVIVIATSGVHTTNPLHRNVFSTEAVDGTNIDAPSVITSIDGCLILRIGTEWGNGGWPMSHTWASGATKILDQQFQSTAYDNALVSPAGASGTRRLTWAQFIGATSQGALTLALAPASTDVAVAGSDPATQSEAASVASTVSFSGVDALVITDASSPSASMARSDAGVFTDAVATTQVLLSVVTDAWSLTEVVNAVGETASKSGSDALTLSEETSAVSSAVAAVDTAVQSELAALANTLSSAESVALTDTANVLRTLYVTGSDSATQAEALALAHYLTSSDALVHSESAAVGEFEFRALFDSLVMIGEQAIQSEIFVSPAITLPTRAVVELWAATVLIGASQTEAGVADPATDAALDDMLTLVNLLTTE